MTQRLPLASIAITALLVLASFAGSAQNNILIYNNGTMFYVNGGPNDSAIVYVDGHVWNQDSMMINLGKFIINGDFVNNDQCGGDGLFPALLQGNNGLFEVHGQWENNGIYRAGLGKVYFPTDGAITGTQMTKFHDVTLGVDVRRDLNASDAQIDETGTLVLQNGEFATDTASLWVLNPNVSAIQRDTNCYDCGFVSSLNEGFLARVMQQSTDYIIPVGSSITDNFGAFPRYRPVIIRPSTAQLDTMYIRYINRSPTTDTMPVFEYDNTDICYVNPRWYHRIMERGNVIQTADLGFFFNQNQGDDFMDAILQRNQNVGQWQDVTNSIPGGTGQMGQVSRLGWTGWNSTSIVDSYILGRAYPDAPVVDGDTTICAGAPIHYTVPNNGSTYTFSVTNGTITSQDQYGFYVIWDPTFNQGQIQVTENVPNSINGGCTSNPRQYTVDIYPQPEASFTINYEDLLGGGIFINDIVSYIDSSSLATSWFWDLGDGTTTTLQNPYHTYSNIGDYTVMLAVLSDSGCADTTYLPLSVIEGMVVPNVFTPNNDGTNDVFIVRTSNIGNYRIRVYNRWGTQVFETTSPEIKWDGRTTAGTDAASGTYYYIIDKADLVGGPLPENNNANFQFKETGWVLLARDK